MKRLGAALCGLVAGVDILLGGVHPRHSGTGEGNGDVY